MKKTFLSLLLSFTLCFNFPCIALAEAPPQPNLDGLSNEEAAKVIDEYNKEVEQYNKEVDENYEKAVQEYEKEIAYNDEAAKHNEAEDAKVEEVAKANATEQARVDAVNQELSENYQKELDTYNSKLASQQPSNEEPRYTQVTNGKETLYYDKDNNVKYKSVAGSTAKDDIETYENIGTSEEPVWSDTYNYNGTNKRYVNFSIISTIGKTTTGTDWDNDASKYSNKVYATIANLNDVTSLPLNYKDTGEGRNLINYKTLVNGEEIGLENCDTLIRNMVNKAIDTYYNSKNGSEEKGLVKSEISFADFPSTLTVFNNLQANGSKFYDPDTGKVITGADINSDNYTLRWFSVKYQSNGWRVSGVLLKNGVIVAPQEPIYEQPNLLTYTPQYMALREAIAPTKGSYLSLLTFVPVVVKIEEPKDEPAQEESIQNDRTIPEVQLILPQGSIANSNPSTINGITPAINNDAVDNATPAADQGASTVTSTRPVSPKSETIQDNDTPLANLHGDKTTVDSWALLNLIFMIITVLLLLIVPREEKIEGYQFQYRSNAIGIILAIAAIITFILTQNIYLTMVIVDKWTILMGVFCAGGIINKIFSHKKIEEE